jgi:cysteine-S-conjugate beta-lyase
MSNMRRHKDSTAVTTVGRDPFANHGVVNPPVYHASTILFPTLAEWRKARDLDYKGARYGRTGTPTTFAFEEAVAEIEGGDRSIAVASGLGAITATLLALAESGDHLLVADTVYGPTRRVCSELLGKFGVETTYYDPLIGAGVADLIQSNTRLVYMESPGTATFEVQDVPAIAAAAHERGAITIADNTWSSPLYFKPFEHGIDVSIHAATKYISGHSDVMSGIITTTNEMYPRIRPFSILHSGCAGPDDCYLSLRGLRTLAVRMPRHQENALILARWLQERPEVERVLHPALPGHPGHDLWKRDFLGSTGLFGVVLKPLPDAALAAFLETGDLFNMGASWGGYESLMIPLDITESRSATAWDVAGQMLRVHAGLEDPDDLIADLELAFENLNRAL